MKYEDIKEQLDYLFKPQPFEKIVESENALSALYFLRDRASTIQCNELICMLIRIEKKRLRKEKEKALEKSK